MILKNGFLRMGLWVNKPINNGFYTLLNEFVDSKNGILRMILKNRFLRMGLWVWEFVKVFYLPISS